MQHASFFQSEACVTHTFSKIQSLGMPLSNHSKGKNRHEELRVERVLFHLQESSLCNRKTVLLVTAQHSSQCAHSTRATEASNSFLKMLLQRIGVHGPLLESPRFRRRPKRSTVLCAMIAACMALMLIATAVLPQVKTMRSLHNSVHADHASALEVRRDMSTGVHS